MTHLAQPLDKLIADQRAGSAEPIDVVVVGSGYGGAVAALRCAEAGLATCILERGNEYNPGDFPRDVVDAPAHFRIDADGITTAGYDHALFDLHVGAETVVVAGNGLGGGSLINANVAMRPDPRVFQREPWPESIQREGLESHFATAENHLHARPYRTPATGTPPKTAAFEGFARAAMKQPARASITVNSGPDAVDVPRGKLASCIGCGDCVSGCNYGAKATLGTTYLAEAYAHGARFFTDATVLRVSRHDDAWRVHFVRTADYRRYQQGQARRAEAKEVGARGRLKHLVEELEHTLDVRTVVLAAGALGSTEILARSTRDLSLSKLVGSRFSGNGDYLSFGYGQDRPVHAVGWGATGSRNDPQPVVVGPTITRIAEFRENDVAKSFVVEDASVPGALAEVFHELVTTASVLPQLDRWSFVKLGGVKDPIARVAEGRTHTQVLLTMGHDDSGGALRLGENGRIRVEWSGLKNTNPFARYDKEQKKVERLGGVYLGNPAWTPIPPSMADVLTGDTFYGRDLIVHPLGGCPMADDAERGAVNDGGAVFRGDKGSDVHPGLYVLDGSIVCTSLGANPFLTITALAERAAGGIVDWASAVKRGAARPQSMPPQAKLPDLPVPARGRKVPVELREVMRGRLLAKERKQDGKQKEKEFAAKLEVQFPTPDIYNEFLATSDHKFDAARASLQLSEIGQGRSMLSKVSYPLAPGTVTILEPIATTFVGHLRDSVLVFLTWLIERGWNELRAPRKVGEERRPGFLKLLPGFLKMLWHAADRRQMLYTFKLTREAKAPAESDGLPSVICFEGRKDVSYAASWPAIWGYLRARLRDLLDRLRGLQTEPRLPLRLERRNLWQSLTDVEVRLRDASVQRAKGDVAAGRLRIAPVEMLDEEHAARVNGETTTGLVGLISYPLFFARYLLKCRIWDFRLPDYTPIAKNLFAREPQDAAAGLVHADQHPPALRTSGIEPRAYRLDVPRRPGAQETIPLVLWRYKNAPKVQAINKGTGTQCNSILLVHAFAQSALSFAEPTLDQNLAEYLYEQGWDVWMLEHRLSIALEAAKMRSTMDDVAALDIPAAVDKCLEVLRAEITPLPQAPLQIYALAQCVGSAALAMSVLSGRLSYGTDIRTTAKPRPGFPIEPRKQSKLAGVAFSQFTPYVSGGPGSQFRSFLPTTLRDVFGLQEFDFAAPGKVPMGEGTQTQLLVDRLLATYPIADAERCPGEHQGSASTQVVASCRRMAGVEAPLFIHKNLYPETHDRLPLLLGKANIDVFAHARKCVDAERLVNADGLNVYVTQDNIQTHLHMPVALLHGLENELFLAYSSRRSYRMFQQCFNKDHVKRRLRVIIFKGYGHLDWLIGKQVHVTTYPEVKRFLDEAWTENHVGSPHNLPELPVDNLAIDAAPPPPVEPPDSRTVFTLDLPTMGPVIGHVRREGDNVVANVFIRPRDMGSALPLGVVADYRTGDSARRKRVVTMFKTRIEAVPLRDPALSTGEARSESAGDSFDLRYSVCRIAVPLDHFPKDGGPLQIDTYIVRRLPTHAGLADANFGFESNPFETMEEAPVATAAAQEPKPDPIIDALMGDKHKALDYRIKRLERISKSVEYQRDRTLRATHSPLRLRKRPLEDRQCELRPHWAKASGEISILATCCRYPGFLVEQHRVDETFRRILGKPFEGAPDTTPSALFMLGDQIYADATAGIFDTTTPIEKFSARYEDFLGSADVRRVLSRIPTYMAIDDHEISDGWETNSRALDEPLAAMALATARVHQLAHSADATFAEDGRLGPTPRAGLLHRARIGDVIPVLFVDTRTNRAHARDGGRLLTDEAWDAIRSWLHDSRNDDAPKIIATSSPIAPGFARFLDEADCLDRHRAAAADNWQGFNDERLQLFELIAKSGCKNVVFLSGDYHCCAVAAVTHRGRRLATAVVVPPAYAPLAYANAKAGDLAETEVLGEFAIELLRLDSDKRASAEGSGYAHLGFSRENNRGWTLHVRFDVSEVCAGADNTSSGGWNQHEYVVDLAAANPEVRADAPEPAVK